MLKKIVLILSIAVISGMQSALYADINDELIDGIYKNNIKIVKTALEKGADPNKASNKIGEPAIYISAYKGNVEIIKLLLEKGAKANAVTDFYRNTTLMGAADGGHLQAFKFFLEKGVDINSKTTDNKTALIFAANSGNPELVKFIAERGVNINSQDKGGWSALMHAASLGKADTVKMLIALKANLNLKGTTKFSRSGKNFSGSFYPGYSAVDISRAANHMDVARILENSGGVSFFDEKFDKGDLKKKLGYFDIEISKANKKAFDEAVKTLKSIIKKDDPEKENKIQKIDNLQYADGQWYIIRLSYEILPPASSFNVAIKDSKGKNILSNIYSYLQTSKRGNILVGYKDNIIMKTTEPIIKNIISKDRSPVTISLKLFKTNEKLMRIYPELE